MEFNEFYFKLTNILEIYKFVLESKVCPETTTQEWLKIITYMYLKDWLWIVTENGKIQAVIGAYRIKEFYESKANDLPSTDEGEILYIPFACSISQDIFVWRKLLRDYLKLNKVSQLVVCDYAKDGYDKHRIYKIKGVQNVSTKTKHASRSDVPTESSVVV